MEGEKKVKKSKKISKEPKEAKEPIEKKEPEVVEIANEPIEQNVEIIESIPIEEIKNESESEIKLPEQAEESLDSEQQCNPPTVLIKEPESEREPTEILINGVDAFAFQKLEEKATKAQEAFEKEEKLRKELEALNSKLLAEKTALLDSLSGEKGALQDFQEKTAKLTAQKNDLDNQLRVSRIFSIELVFGPDQKCSKNCL